MKLPKAVSRTTVALTLAGVGLTLPVAGSPANAARGGNEAPGALAGEETSRVVLRDGTGDVWKVNIRTPHCTPVGDTPSADVRRAVIKHRARAVVVRTRFEDLKRIGVQTYWAGITTRDDDFFAEVVSRPRARAGRHTLYDGPGGAQIKCAGGSQQIDYRGDTVTVRLPRACLGQPRWVKVNAGNRLAVGDRPHRRHYADNPHNHEGYANVGTRRIYRG